ncbi:acyl-CoA reductase [uncultured Ruminococcus sp.]|uniref:acyl-CoA reductase n=1 Tax=uncultured Ruminococcus sp. TaxID=165186 RepID=UPI00260AF3FD|nr:acyl-CoA reductase [uncultured Ruminococcus sp.]
MQINSDKIEFLVGNAEVLERSAETPVLPMFSEQMKSFLSDLSRELFADPRSKGYKDVLSYAYWIRSASLQQAESRHNYVDMRLGRGLALHIAPSNVPVNFAVSMTSSALAGNISVVRLSSKQFVQADIICSAMERLLTSSHTALRTYFCIIRYPHDPEITGWLSSMCDIRIIWGGDRTINEVRALPLPTRAIEMTFADRFSAAVINSDEYLVQDSKKVAEGFYTDTYYTDQNACSSPRFVIWTGNSVPEARERFWEALAELVDRDYDMQPLQAVDKYTAVCAAGMSMDGIKLISSGNRIVRAELERLTPDVMKFKTGGGLFFEYTASSLEEIVPILTKQCQTLSLLGISVKDVKELVFRNGVRGCDRIVPLGQTMGLEFIWDGFRMIETMTRYVYYDK